MSIKSNLDSNVSRAKMISAWTPYKIKTKKIKFSDMILEGPGIVLPGNIGKCRKKNSPCYTQLNSGTE